MEGIKEFLKKFTTLRSKEKLVREVFEELLAENNLPKFEIKFQNGIIYTSAPSVVRSEVLIIKDKLLSGLNKRLEIYSVSVLDII